MSQSNPLLLLGHGTRDANGRQAFLDFAHQFQTYDASRPVIPCFLELSDPLIQVGIDRCVELGYQELTVLPVLLFAARHSKFDVTNELDRARQRHPQLTLHYGRHFGVSLRWLELWQKRLEQADRESAVPREKTVLLFVGRGASDPDANGDVYKLARMLWEGSGYGDLEVCFTGITHPRMERGFERARAWNPERIIVIPHLLFTGVLAKRIETIVEQQQVNYPGIEVQSLSVIGTDPILFELIRDREQEAQTGQVAMNCYTCKFRQTVSAQGHGHHEHNHDHGHNNNHGHGHGHAHPEGQTLYHGIPDLYPEEEDYHQRAWQVP
ncbi:MAG: sirohydrochlorin chelatase [Cyanobacteria bacterium P01_H01_bin.105]